MKIEGIPDGWELVRIGTPTKGESYVNHEGKAKTCEGIAESKGYCIIRRIPPPLSIPPKVFRDGWLIENPRTGHVMWSATQPYWIKDEWFGTSHLCVVSTALGCVTFADGFPECERICRVTWELGSECEQ